MFTDAETKIQNLAENFAGKTGLPENQHFLQLCQTLTTLCIVSVLPNKLCVTSELSDYRDDPIRSMYNKKQKLPTNTNKFLKC